MTFAPARRRANLLAHELPRLDFRPRLTSPEALARHITECVDVLCRCYWLGLASIAHPKLRVILTWLEGQSPSDFHCKDRVRCAPWPAERHYVEWWQAVGLAKWLTRDDPATADFQRAVGAQLELDERVAPSHSMKISGRQDRASALMALALSADAPAQGLEFYNRTDFESPIWTARPVLEFGEWACTWLAQGHQRDATFVKRGRGMLDESLFGHFRYLPSLIEATLWLKIIYFDGGAEKTALQTIAKAYDSMPGDVMPEPLRLRPVLH